MIKVVVLGVLKNIRFYPPLLYLRVLALIGHSLLRSAYNAVYIRAYLANQNVGDFFGPSS